MNPRQTYSCISCRLSKCPVRVCSEEWKEKLDSVKITRIYPKKQNIYWQGMAASGVYFINSGKVSIVAEIGQEKDQIVRLLKEGDVFGIPSRDEKTSFIFSSFALDDSVICFIDNKNITPALYENPEFSVTLLYYYIRSMQKIEIRLRNLARMSAREKVADAILFLHSVYGAQKQNNASVLEIKMSQRDLGKLCSLSEEMVCRTLKGLTDEKLVSANGKNIAITNFGGLMKIVSDFPSLYLES